ncbi:enolase C-terminal domain-like protein [Amycolatopsis sp. NPDC004079]|uniref:Mandelate racemase/muconate lactonizing enzyme family protein n=1 Tax=Amycolatopsis halotolerans TaxID=330083 RepID=A0ABV7QFH0_9PSEU
MSGVRLESVTVGLDWRAAFANAYVRVSGFSTTIVRLRPDPESGLEGIGEAAPSMLGRESARTVAADYASLSGSGLLRDVRADDPETWAPVLRALSGRPAALAGVETALLDLSAKEAGLPLWRWWGLSGTGPTRTFFTIPMVGGAELEHWIGLGTELGATRLKVKVGNPGAEPRSAAADRLRRTRAGFPQAPIRVDANAAWELEDAADFAGELLRWEVGSLEEPLAEGASVQDFADLRALTGLPVFADEFCTSPRALARAADRYDGVVLKTQNWGGLGRTRRAIETARRNGLAVCLGCNAETSVSIGASAQLASLADDLDLDSALLIHEDPFMASGIEGTEILPGSAPGIGAREAGAPR